MMENTTTAMITTTPETFTEIIDGPVPPDAAAVRERELDLSAVAAAAAERRERQAWAMTADLRGALNAMGLCVRVLETAPTDAEAREYVRHLTATMQRLERLIAKRHVAKSA
jgi:hypothetical protein